MRAVVTGDTGFKGAWLALILQARGDDVVGIGLPPEDPRGMYAVACDHDHRDVDIRNRDAIARELSSIAPDVVFHLAAQALVRRSYAHPFVTYETNVLGTLNVLDALPLSVDAAVVVTSDKVYLQDGTPRRFVEGDALGGADPYSASKACAELVVAEWTRRNDKRVTTARAGNVVGGGDRGADRLLPDVVRGIEAGEPAKIRNPGATRPWQHVLDPLHGYLAIADALLAGGDVPPALNIGPDDSATVADVLSTFVRGLGAGEWLADSDEHPHEAATLALDASLARKTIAWRPRLGLDEALSWTAAWYRAQLGGDDLVSLTRSQIDDFGALA